METPAERVNRRGLARVWGLAVAQRRRAASLSQAQLARRCGVEQQTISKIETGRAIPRDELKQAIAAALGSHPWQLFAWPGQPSTE